MSKFFYTLIIILLTSEVFSQKQANYWYFGHEAGLDFSGGAPIAITDGKLVSIEGSAVMSDENGKLLFYTNGERIWNKQHQLMPNGSDLLGNESAVQSALIVPLPSSSDKYYVFINGSYRTSIFSYSIVDLALNNGLGDVDPDQKNIILASSSSEALAATSHCNNEDYWIVTQVPDSVLRFQAYLLCASGISSPVTSSFDIPSLQREQVAHLKFSTDGKQIVASSFITDTHIFNFNKSTGKLTLSTVIPSSSQFQEMTYASAFSPDNSKLYLSTWEWSKFPDKSYCNLVQYDLSAANISATRVVLDTVDFTYGSPNAYGFRGNLQLGPDNKIYVCRWKQALPFILPETYYTLDSLDVINNPNQQGKSCRLVRNQIWLKGKPTTIGLPSFLESYFDKTAKVPFFIAADYVADTVCWGEATSFQDLSTSSCEVSNWEWNFGDATSGTINQSRLKNPFHQFSQPGNYMVTLKVSSGCSSAVITKSIYVRPAPRVDLGPDTVLCENDMLLLQLQNDKQSYRWQDGSSSNTFLVKTPGIYWVEVQSGECFHRDSIRVEYWTPPIISLGNDTILCAGQSLVLSINHTDLTYLWQDGSTNGSFTVTKPGIYWVEVANKACHFRDTIKVTQATLPDFTLPADTIVCLGKTLTLDFYHPNLDYHWSDNSTSSQLLIDTPGQYWVEYRIKGTACARRQDINVSFKECLDELYIPNVITPNEDGKNDTFRIQGAPGTTWYCKLYNRWGKSIAEFADYQHNWDGKGIENGIYFYTLTSMISGKTFKGWIQVIR